MRKEFKGVFYTFPQVLKVVNSEVKVNQSQRREKVPYWSIYHFRATNRSMPRVGDKIPSNLDKVWNKSRDFWVRKSWEKDI